MARKRISREKYRAMRRAISKANLIGGKYIGKGEGQVCALGALALEAGVPPTVLRIRNTENIHRRPSVARAIKNKFGLTDAEQRKLQYVNDVNLSTPDSRKDRVLTELQRIYEDAD